MRSSPVPHDHKPTEFGASPDSTALPLGSGHRVGAWFLHELREVLPPTIFFFVGFNLIVLTTT